MISVSVVETDRFRAVKRPLAGVRMRHPPATRATDATALMSVIPKIKAIKPAMNQFPTQNLMGSFPSALPTPPAHEDL